MTPLLVEVQTLSVTELCSYKLFAHVFVLLIETTDLTHLYFLQLRTKSGISNSLQCLHFPLRYAGMVRQSFRLHLIVVGGIESTYKIDNWRIFFQLFIITVEALIYENGDIEF